MGVPGFFLWLWKRYKSKNFVFTKTNIPSIDAEAVTNVDYFLIDMNCMIHPVCFDTLKEITNKKIDTDELENKMINNVIIYLEKTIQLADPKKGVYVAVDGVAPVAKMKQQRLRRYKSVRDKEVFDNIRKKHKKEIPFFWSNSAITPGTNFMKTLTRKLTDWGIIYSRTHNVEIIFSPSSVPAEGEHKLLQFIRNNTVKYNYVVYGLDADLIFLMLTTGLDSIYLMREANKMDSKVKDVINFISLRTMKQCVIDSIDSIIKKNEFPITLESTRVIDDFIFICYLMGNDFLPHINSLDIYENAIDTLLNCYVDMIYCNGTNLPNGYVIDRTSKNYVNGDMLYNYMIKLAGLEEQTIVEAHRKKKYKSQCTSNDPFDIEMHRIDNMMFKVKDTIQLGEGNIMDWRERYYNHYYHVAPEELDRFASKMVYHYMVGLKWVTMYYFNKCPSWDWYYMFDHAPFLCDIVISKELIQSVFNDNSPVFNESTPLTPFEQLLTVLPKDSNYLLPVELRKIMTNINSSAGHLYPSRFELDMIGKKKYWMCHPILPNLEINLIRKIFEKYSKLLSTDAKDLNKLGTILTIKPK